MSYDDFPELCARYEAVLGEIRRAEGGCGRSGVRLIAAAKYATAEELDALARNCGLDVIGENRADTLLEHYSGMKEKVEIHFIGHLQRNKVKQIIDKVSLIHSLDSEGLAEEIERQAARLGITARVLCEINIGREASKSGVMPEDASDFCAGLGKYPHIKLCGFMTMAPICANEDEYYKYFTETYDLALDIWRETLHNIGTPELSMGMSASFRPAIASGATMVRLGSSVFGRTTADMQKKNKI